jgi:LDH2 family malate/lactate/ureidoglycolate dehydrogenase
MDTLVRRIHECPKAEGFSEVLVPGEIEAREEAKRRRSGIPFSRGELATLQEEAARAGIAALETAHRPLGSP